MSKQLTLSEGFEQYAKTTKRAQFLREMDRIIPWTDLCELIAPVYPVAGAGRPPRELEMMLRIYFLQQWLYRLGLSGHRFAIQAAFCMA